jgi:hypothetical protein
LLFLGLENTVVLFTTVFSLLQGDALLFSRLHALVELLALVICFDRVQQLGAL